MQNTSTSSLPTFLHSLLPEALHPFVTLAYRIPSSKLRIIPSSARIPEQLYGKGPQDVYFVAFCALAFTVLRELTMRYVLSTFARYWLGAKERERKGVVGKAEKRRIEHIVLRFAEQGWSFFYCTLFTSLGIFILSRIPRPFSPESLWGTYPVTALPPLTKFYYLAQLGWWFHQIYVINHEKRRNDHWQMFGHHILSISLILGSYIAHFTRVGTVIHSLMDFCDILLPLAKMFRYLSLTTCCDITFVVFLVSWLFTRQIGLALVIRTAYFDAPRFIPFKWDPSRGMYLTKETYYGFIGMLAILWVLASVWFYMACMVAVRVVRGLGAEDSRSDDEDEGSELEGVAQPNNSSGGTTALQNGHLNGDARKRR